MTVTLKMPKEIESQLLADAQAHGVPLADYVRNFIVEHYHEDLEDNLMAQARLNDPKSPITSGQLRKNLGLDS
jgi:predicted DNA-binding protein